MWQVILGHALRAATPLLHPAMQEQILEEAEARRALNLEKRMQHCQRRGAGQGDLLETDVGASSASEPRPPKKADASSSCETGTTLASAGSWFPARLQNLLRYKRLTTHMLSTHCSLAEELASDRKFPAGSVLDTLDSHSGPESPLDTVSCIAGILTDAGGSKRCTDKMVERTEGMAGSMLPFMPLCLTFRNINYYVPLPKVMETTDPEKVGPRATMVGGKRFVQLLRDCSGVFQPGVSTALIGASGAGKTTLIDVLAGRKTTGKVDGIVRISGHPKEQRSFARVSGYAEQTDIHSPLTTVYEALWLSARLRNGNEASDQALHAFIEEVESVMELGALRSCLVGRPGKCGLSVEQRKRLTIAVELVANPSILFVEEPTSGLDARATAVVMRSVRKVCNTGRTVVCTIHQPSVDIFEEFDDLLLMKVGGEIIYQGPLGYQSSVVVQYFEELPGVPRLGVGENPASWMLRVSAPQMEASIGLNFAAAFKNSCASRDLEVLMERLETPPAGSRPLQFDCPVAQSRWVQYCLLLKRNLVCYWRNPSYNCTRFTVAVASALLFGSIYWQAGKRRSTIQDLAYIFGCLYLATLFLAFVNSTSVQTPVSYERGVSYRESAAGMYGHLPFALAACSVEVPYILLQNALFCLISYWMIGFQSTGHQFFWYFLTNFLTLLILTNYGILAVYATPNLVAATVASKLVVGFWTLFAGFIIPRMQVPIWFRWYTNLNPLYWALYGILASQLAGSSELVSLGPGLALVPTKDYLEMLFGYKTSFLGWVALILTGYAFTFAFAAVLALRVLHYQKR